MDAVSHMLHYSHPKLELTLTEKDVLKKVLKMVQPLN